MKDKKDFTFGQFIKRLWWVLLILIIIPLAALGTFIGLMAKGVCNISDLGSMLGGLLAYIGTVLLGLVSVWQVERQRKENLETILQQNYEQNKGCLQIYIEVIYDHVVLVVKNLGKSEIYNGSITFDEEWIERLDNFGDIAIAFKKSLLKSVTNNIYLAANQEIRFLLHYIQSDSAYYKFLIEQDCCVTICYETLGERIEQNITLNFHSVLTSYYGLNIDEESVKEISENYKKQIKEIGHINESIKTLNSNIALVSNQLKEINKKIK